MTIGELAARSRLSTKALRLYDRLGLLEPARVDPATGYRIHAEGQVADARLIALLRRIDMSWDDPRGHHRRRPQRGGHRGRLLGGCRCTPR